MSPNFHFNISLTVLNSLGRDLYRSFSTILGEAISNSWDADAKNLNIYIDRDENYLIIKDDGVGMDEDDFQNKFLKVGFSKRSEGVSKSPGGRPFIGRKGIGKLALLSCSEKVHIISKKEGADYVGAVIDNTKIDNDIENDVTTEEHSLDTVDINIFKDYIEGHSKGTIIKFENLNGGIKNRIDFFKRAIALYYRFSLVDNEFNIFVNDEKITEEELQDLIDTTQIFWMVNDLRNDPLIKKIMDKADIEIGKDAETELPIKGFIATVNKPSNLKMRGVDERLTLDLFVNGRLREKDIYRHISGNRIYEAYVYGQIHYDDLDDETDRFTSSREGVKSDDEKFSKLLNELRTKILYKVTDEWDEIRLRLRQDGDADNPRKTKKYRKAKSLVNEVSNDYKKSDDSTSSSSGEDSSQATEDATETNNKIDEWVKKLSDDATFNVESYTECFIAENLLRSYIDEKGIELNESAQQEVAKYQKREQTAKDNGGVSIEIRSNSSDKTYLDMDKLSHTLDGAKGGNQNILLTQRAKEYKPMRDATMHTALLTDDAKTKLTSVFNEIKARLKNIFHSS